MAEGAVEGLVQRLGSDAEPRGGGAIVAEGLLQAAVLSIAAYILKAGDLLHPRKQDWAPVREILHVVRLNGVLIHGIARSPSNAQVLRSLEKSRCNWKPIQLRPQAVDHIRRGDFPLIQLLQCYKHEAPVR